MREQDLLLTERERYALKEFVDRTRAALGGAIREVRVYGSRARGDAGPDSDLDVLVILADGDWRQQDALLTIGARASLECDVLLSVLALKAGEWGEMVECRLPLVANIQADGVSLMP